MDKKNEFRIVMYEGKEVGQVLETGNDLENANAAKELLESLGLHKKVSIEQSIFASANAFAHVALDIHKTKIAVTPPVMNGFAPYIVNGTLAIELYIKSMHSHYGKFPQGHHLENLYKGLQREAKDITHKYAISLQGKYGIELTGDLSVYLQEIGKAFVDWRYLYEKEQLSMNLLHLQYVFEVISRASKDLMELKEK